MSASRIGLRRRYGAEAPSPPGCVEHVCTDRSRRCSTHIVHKGERRDESLPRRRLTPCSGQPAQLRPGRAGPLRAAAAGRPQPGYGYPQQPAAGRTARLRLPPAARTVRTAARTLARAARHAGRPPQGGGGKGEDHRHRGRRPGRGRRDHRRRRPPHRRWRTATAARSPPYAPYRIVPPQKLFRQTGTRRWRTPPNGRTRGPRRRRGGPQDRCPQRQGRHRQLHLLRTGDAQPDGPLRAR